MALVKSAAASVLPGHAHVDAVFHQARERQSLGHAIIDGAFARAHFGALLEQLLHLGMNVEAFGISGQALREFG